MPSIPLGDKLTGDNAVLQYSADGKATWAYFLGAKSLPFPEEEATKIDVSDINSVGPEYLFGDSTIGDVEFECSYSEATYQQYEALSNAGTVLDWRIVLSNGNSFGFQGQLKVVMRPVERGNQVIFRAAISASNILPMATGVDPDA